MNYVSLSGCTLVNDVDYQRIQDKWDLSKIFVAINEKDKNGKETTVFIGGECWGGWARGCAHFRKGQRVNINGKLAMDQWTDKNGQNKTRIKIKIQSIFALAERPQNASSVAVEMNQPQQPQRDPHGGQWPGYQVKQQVNDAMQRGNRQAAKQYNQGSYNPPNHVAPPMDEPPF